MFICISAIRRWPLLAAVVVAAAASAQPVSRPDPANAKAAVPPATYTSPLAGYRRLSDDKPITWRQANDTAARAGGWRTYARQAAEPASAASSTQGRP